jgi:hypothetical protein
VGRNQLGAGVFQRVLGIILRCFSIIRFALAVALPAPGIDRFRRRNLE